MSTNENTEHLYIAILCGGGGKRLWPRSRVQTPKQFIKLFGDKTIFQKTIERVEKIIDPKRILVITNKDYLDEVNAQAPQIPQENILLEPLAKNTALAVGYGALMAQIKDPEAVVINLPSDHFVKDVETFDTLLEKAYQTALKSDYLVTLGITPTEPETGYGYIKMGEPWKETNIEGVLKVAGFTEKPDLETAKQFLESNVYAWNAGIYAFNLNTFFKAVADHSPQLSATLEKLKNAVSTKNEEEIKLTYEQAEEISIDYALAEKADNILVISGSFGWSDIGDWEAVWDISEKDVDGNALVKEGGKGDFVSLETQNCLIQVSDQLVTTIGVKDLLIIDTKDALLVASKDKAQDVKKLTGLLKEKGKTEYL